MSETVETPRLKAIYGNKVTLQNIRTGDIHEYSLVTFNQEKLDQNIISNYTKVGKAIWAKEEGAIVDIDMPTGRDQFKITKIDFA